MFYGSLFIARRNPSVGSAAPCIYYRRSGYRDTQSYRRSHLYSITAITQNNMFLSPINSTVFSRNSTAVPAHQTPKTVKRRPRYTAVLLNGKYIIRSEIESAVDPVTTKRDGQLYLPVDFSAVRNARKFIVRPCNGWYLSE